MDNDNKTAMFEAFALIEESIDALEAAKDLLVNQVDCTKETLDTEFIIENARIKLILMLRHEDAVLTLKTTFSGSL